MRQPKGFIEYGKEGCCPDDWNHVPNITGNFEMDASIMKSKNKDAHARLADHIASDTGYRINSGYTRKTID
jgi:hypothetical protein